MQCKDIPDLPILEFLATHGLPGMAWCNWCFGDENDVHQAMPSGIPDKLVLAKMRVLMTRGLVSGCPCGCRGDFALTKEGERFLLTANPNFTITHQPAYYE